MRSSTVLLALALTAVAAGDADARRRRTMGSGSFASNGKFGLGLELGAPTGFNGKYFLQPDRALNFGIGALGYFYERDGLHLYLDYLFHFKLLREESFQMPFYVGVGARLWNFDYPGDRANALGVRVPLGIAFDFNNVPLDVFVQLTFVADLFFNYPDRRFGPHFEGSIGIRYWFD